MRGALAVLALLLTAAPARAEGEAAGEIGPRLVSVEETWPLRRAFRPRLFRHDGARLRIGHHPAGLRPHRPRRCDPDVIRDCRLPDAVLEAVR